MMIDDCLPPVECDDNIKQKNGKEGEMAMKLESSEEGLERDGQKCDQELGSK